MSRLLLTSAAALALGAHAAMAGGVAPEPAPAIVIADPAPVSDWTGFFAGIGFGQLDTDDGADSDTAMFHALSAGYLYDLGSIVVGGDIGLIDHAAFDGPFDGYDDFETRLRLRVGYDAGRVLPYVTVGTSMWQVDTPSVSGTDTTFGFGLGVEVMVTDSIMLGLDYYRSRNDSFDVGEGPYAKTADTLGMTLSLRF